MEAAAEKSSTPAVVPGAAPALAKAGVGGYITHISHNLYCPFFLLIALVCHAVPINEMDSNEEIATLEVNFQQSGC